MVVIELLGGAGPYVESMSERLAADGFAVGGAGDHPGVQVIYADSEERWLGARPELIPTVFVLPTLDIESFVRALAMGAGAVHADSSSAVIADVVKAIAVGEVRVPVTIAQSLATHVPPSTRDIRATALDPVEERLAEAVRSGWTVKQMALELAYSERTVRRKLQGLYLKIGVQNRDDAFSKLAV